MERTNCGGDDRVRRVDRLDEHRSAAPALRPRIVLRGGRAVYVGPSFNLAPHRNLVATLALALGPPFRLRVLDREPATEPTAQSIALIPPGVRHHLQADGDMAFLYVDALSDDYAQCQATDFAAAQRAVTRTLLEGDALACDVALRDALGLRARPPQDGRMIEVIRRIDAEPQAFDSIADAARQTGLSASHFQALFRSAVGMPFRRYRLWRRIAIVLQNAAAGASLTDAAHTAGFSSSAHLSATFKAMFGVTPSRLLASGVQFATLAGD